MFSGLRPVQLGGFSLISCFAIIQHKLNQGYLSKASPHISVSYFVTVRRTPN